ncbi:MAG: thioredoxin family protein [Prochloraceae cyanobacterium]
MVASINKIDFDRDVLQSSAPVLVHFWAPWCGLCRMINPVLIKVQSECVGHIELIGIDADQNLKLANNYRLKSLPTIILFHQGQIVYRTDEFKSREDLLQKLNRATTDLLAKSA